MEHDSPSLNKNPAAISGTNQVMRLPSSLMKTSSSNVNGWAVFYVIFHYKRIIMKEYFDPRDWIMPRGRPHASWLRQVDSYLKDAGLASVGDGQTEAYLKDMGMTGLASVWAIARRRPI